MVPRGLERHCGLRQQKIYFQQWWASLCGFTSGRSRRATLQLHLRLESFWELGSIRRLRWLAPLLLVPLTNIQATPKTRLKMVAPKPARGSCP